jgi:protein-tyrosine phosphatase
MTKEYLFGPASKEERIVFGAQRPGYHAANPVGAELVQAWISCMKEQGIKRVCCLLSARQLRYYADNLLGVYQIAFGKSQVCWAAIEDFHLCEARRLAEEILPFLGASDVMQAPVVVHCSGGSGRTGHILAAWLVYGHNFSVECALQTVRVMGRNPYEAVECGNATMEDLEVLLRSSTRPEIA